ncbi:MAG TPA: 30S ribosome-binding factor RbfA [Opitutaceae bacterium]|nr:30S ribosome-binding factor RbfA [Opitutaceae bacterium]
MSNRLLRVNELLQREISAYLHSKYSSESVGITITGADVTGDLREAKIYYSALGRGDETERAGRWLRSKLGEIRSVVAKNVVIRHVPLLTFVPDTAADRGLRIEQLLDEIDPPKSGKPEA